MNYVKSKQAAIAKALAAARAKARMKKAIGGIASVFPDDDLLTFKDKVAKTQTLHSSQYLLGRPTAISASMDALRKKAARKVVGGHLSTPAQRAESKFAAKKAAQKRINALTAARKRRELTPQEVLRLKTDTEAILNVAIPPSQTSHRGMNLLPPKRKSAHKLWRKPHIRKRFPKGKRPRKLQQVVETLRENNLLTVPTEVAIPVLSVLIPKIRSRKASPLSVAKVLKSPQAKKLSDAHKKRRRRRKRTSAYHRHQLKRFAAWVARLKLMQKRMRTLERMRVHYATLNDAAEVGHKTAQVQELSVQIAGQEAKILTEAIQEAPEVKNMLEDDIAVAIAEANIEDAAEEMPESSEAEVLQAVDTNGGDALLVIDAQVAALLDEAAPTVDDAVPVVVAESDTPAIDPDIIETLETQQGKELSPEEILDLADSVSVQLGDEILTDNAKILDLGFLFLDFYSQCSEALRTVATGSPATVFLICKPFASLNRGLTGFAGLGIFIFHCKHRVLSVFKSQIQDSYFFPCWQVSDRSF
jgi:hypothetical protein